ncbi:testis-expressed sequence 36 protein [Arapaima gigas]
MKGRNRYTWMENEGKWFAHAGLRLPKEKEIPPPDDAGPMVLLDKRYPRIFKNPEQKTECREYLFSVHDNRDALRYSIETYDNGLGRKKFLDERRQHNSDMSLLAQGDSNNAEERRHSLPTYLSDYQTHGKTEDTTRRRFPRSHLERSKDATVQAIEDFMWFGRNDSIHVIPLSVLSATHWHAGKNPWKYSYHSKH